MILAYRCEEKRAHHISYLTQMDARWKGRQFSRLPQVSFGVWVYDFQQPEAYVDNKIATTKMAVYYLLVYKNSPKECSSCFLWKFLCPDSSEAQGTQFLAWMIGSLLQNLNLLKAHLIEHLLYMQSWFFVCFLKLAALTRILIITTLRSLFLYSIRLFKSMAHSFHFQ